MKVEINSKKNATADIVIYMIMAIVIAVILIPMIVLRENYYLQYMIIWILGHLYLKYYAEGVFSLIRMDKCLF